MNYWVQKNKALLCILMLLMLSPDIASKEPMQILHPAVKALQGVVDDNIYLPSLLPLKGESQLKVSFDFMGSDRPLLAYNIIPCNANWRPTPINYQEAIEGFNEIIMDDPLPSFNTYHNYYHYTLTLPNEQIQFKQSGNYLLTVYRQEDNEQILFTYPFSVYENLVTILSIPTVPLKDELQQIDLSLQLKGISIPYPQEEILITVTQNNEEGKPQTVTAPTYIGKQELIYKMQPSLQFPSGNEYRRFDISAHTYAGIGVSSVRFITDGYQVQLQTDKERATTNYQYDQTQWGRFVVRTIESEEPETDADYYQVFHRLQYPSVERNGEIYIDGYHTQGLPMEMKKMIYNKDTQAYETSMLLKQGAYNYRYLFKPYDSQKSYPFLVEGNHRETSNEYTVRVFHRPRLARYDRLIGIATFHTNK